MKIDKDVADFLISQKVSISHQLYSGIYAKAVLTFPLSILPLKTTQITYVFRKSGIDPLKYMDHVPAFYAIANKEIDNVVIPDGIRIIENRSFNQCSELTEVKIPVTVERIMAYAFEGCPKLTNIIYDGTQKQWENVARGYNWKDKSPKFVIHCTDGELEWN